MDKILIIVCAVVGSLGVLSAIFGFSAEGTKLTPYTILALDDGECIYPPNPALGLGISAAIFLLAAQVTFTAVGGCCGCCGKSRSNPSSPSETKRIVGIVCAVVSWIAAVIAWVLLIEGAAWNANVVGMDGPYCRSLKDGIFAGAGVLCLAATALGIASYVLMRTKRVNAAPPQVVPAELPPAGNEPPQNPEPQLPAADTVLQPAMASPPEPGPGELPPPSGPAETTPPVQLPQVGEPQSQGSEHPIRRRLIRALIRVAARVGMRVLVHSLCSDSIDTPTAAPGVGDILDSLTEPQSTEAV